MKIRHAEASEIKIHARLWHDGGQDAHAETLPADLKRVRTLESFEARLKELRSDTRVAGESDNPLGFCITKGDELYQLYVSSEARGSGVASALIADAEGRLRANGVKTAWLACAIGNDRAARFYEKSDWHRAGTMINELETPEGEFLLEVWRYEKML